ncbi:MAG: hypothetical protein K8F30_08545 [Taibaiella sp.]|nr:hypothetical protein [Taibaiella sp.]
MKKYLLLMILFPFLTACENTWDGDARDMFVQACMKTARENGTPEDKAQKMCDCRLEKIMEKHPNFAEAMENITDVIDDPEVKKCDELAQ